MLSRLEPLGIERRELSRSLVSESRNIRTLQRSSVALNKYAIIFTCNA